MTRVGSEHKEQCNDVDGFSRDLGKSGNTEGKEQRVLGKTYDRVQKDRIVHE